MKILAFFLALPLVLGCSCAVALVPPEYRQDVVLDTTPELGATAAFLLSAVDLQFPVFIQDAALLEHGIMGRSQDLGGAYLVELDYRLTPREKAMVLVHELAHVLVWDAGIPDSSSHGPLWGQAWAELWRLYTREDALPEPEIRLPRDGQD